MQRSGPVSGTGAPNAGYGYPGRIRPNERITDKFIQNGRISKGSWNGPRRELHGAIWECPYSKTATGQKTLNTGRGPYLRGLADDVMLRQYGTCDICRSFGDTFYVTAPATVIHVREQRCWSHA